jgi:hypothetical protein
VSLISLDLVVLILTTQRGDDRLTERLDLLNLELTILSEQKIAMVVALLEELRHDRPHLRDREDELAEGMAQPTDPQSVIDAINKTRSESALVLPEAGGFCALSMLSGGNANGRNPIEEALRHVDGLAISRLATLLIIQRMIVISPSDCRLRRTRRT